MRPIARVLGRWSSAFELEDAPASVVATAKRSLLDTIGVMLAGSRTAPAVCARETVADQYGPGPCHVCGDERRSTAAGAALANGFSAQVLDYDDTCYAGIAHISATVLPAVLATAEARERSGRDLLTAFVVGSEAAYVLGRIATDSLYEKGWYTTAVLGAMGAAVGAAKVGSLDADATTRALSLAVSQAAGIRVFLGTVGKPYSGARAAEGGVVAAEFARRGASAPPAVFEARSGFLDVYNGGRSSSGVLDALGKSFAFDTPGIAYKLYPVCSAAQAAIEACVTLRDQHRIDPDTVARVHCEVSPLVHHLLTCEMPRSVMEAQFCLPFAVSCALVLGRLTVNELTMETLWEERLQAMMRRVTMSLSPEMAADPDVMRNSPEGVRVVIVTTGGSELVAVNRSAIGTPRRPLTDAELERKFLACARRAVPPERAEMLLERLKQIENVPSAVGLLG